MDPIGWIKTNLIIILAVALGITLVFGSIGTLVYKLKFQHAELRAQVAEANLATAAATNASLTQSVDHQNEAIKTVLAACTVTKEAADTALKAALAAGAPARALAKTLQDFQPATNTAASPCAGEHSVLDKFFEEKRKGMF